MMNDSMGGAKSPFCGRNERRFVRADVCQWIFISTAPSLQTALCKPEVGCSLHAESCGYAARNSVLYATASEPARETVSTTMPSTLGDDFRGPAGVTVVYMLLYFAFMIFESKRFVRRSSWLQMTVMVLF